MTEIYITAARRTPIGSFRGALSPVPATGLGAASLRGVIDAAGIDPHAIDECYMGCVLTAGLGMAPARQASRLAGIPDSVPCTTINKVCGSGMKAVMIACDQIRAGSADVIAAGGMESMSRAPHLLPGTRDGWAVGERVAPDHMLVDGLTDPDEGRPMGWYAEQCASRLGISRARHDAWAGRSLRRASESVADGSFDEEIVPVATDSDATPAVMRDEQPGRANPGRIPSLPPVFSPRGIVTAAGSAGIGDGAAALLLMSAFGLERTRTKPLARIIGYTGVARAPGEFTTAPQAAIRKLLGRLGRNLDEFDLFEINEAFAPVVIAAIDDLGLDPARVNVRGGACALGHPIGATGARLVVTLLHALRSSGLSRGIACPCIGGGEATAIAVECT